MRALQVVSSETHTCTNTYMMIVVVVVVAAELVVQESVLKFVNQERFHIQKVSVKKLKKKEKEKLYVR